MAALNWGETSSDDLSVMVRKLRDMTETPGWQQLLVLWGDEIATQLRALLMQPAPSVTADDYALKHADRAGFVRALQKAQKTPYDVIKSAENELKNRQQYAEQAQPE